MAAPSESYITGLASELIAEQMKSNQRNEHHGLIARYLEGDHDLPYIPPDRREELKIMAKRSITNLLPRVSDTFVKLLTVDGYRADTDKQNADAWRYWQMNKLDSRQTIATRGAIEFGASYVLVLPGDRGPVIRPLDPRRSMAWYEDEDDDWPVYSLRYRGGFRSNSDARWEMFDNKYVYTLIVPGDGGEMRVVSTEEHGLGVNPFVRFRERLDGKPTGIIKPLIVPQDRINDSVFLLTMGMHYASFRQRYGTGIEIPVDERPTYEDVATDDEWHEIAGHTFDPERLIWVDSNGDPAELTGTRPMVERPNPNFGQPMADLFDAGVDRLWVTKNPNAKFGDFGQTSVSDHITAIDQGLRTMAALGQLPAGLLRGDLTNVSADALATLYDVTNRQADVYKLLFGEAWEQVFALAAIADHTQVPPDARVKWRDTQTRSLAATVDALGKMVQMLNLPYEAAWEMIPDSVQADWDRWRKMRAEQVQTEQDAANVIAAALARQTTPTEAVVSGMNE